MYNVLHSFSADSASRGRSQAEEIDIQTRPLDSFGQRGVRNNHAVPYATELCDATFHDDGKLCRNHGVIQHVHYRVINQTNKETLVHLLMYINNRPP